MHQLFDEAAEAPTPAESFFAEVLHGRHWAPMCSVSKSITYEEL
jgi:hypothetical protein